MLSRSLLATLTLMITTLLNTGTFADSVPMRETLEPATPRDFSSPPHKKPSLSQSAPGERIPPGTEPDVTSTGFMLAPDTSANPYGLTALWEHGDFFAKGVLVILFLMSIAAWYILLTKLAGQALLNPAADRRSPLPLENEAHTAKNGDSRSETQFGQNSDEGC